MVDTPVPIPNTEVKHHSGDDSVSKSSTLPVLFFYSLAPFWGIFLFFSLFVWASSLFVGRKAEISYFFAELKILAVGEGGQTQEMPPHEGEEFGYVLSGEITLCLGKQKFVCKKGNSFYYKADKPHYIINQKKTEAVFIWISTPPTF